MPRPGRTLPRRAGMQHRSRWPPGTVARRGSQLSRHREHGAGVDRDAVPGRPLPLGRLPPVDRVGLLRVRQLCPGPRSAPQAPRRRELHRPRPRPHRRAVQGVARGGQGERPPRGGGLVLLAHPCGHRRIRHPHDLRAGPRVRDRRHPDPRLRPVRGNGVVPQDQRRGHRGGVHQHRDGHQYRDGGRRMRGGHADDARAAALRRASSLSAQT